MCDAVMPVCVGINGFGSIGKAVLFSSFTEPTVKVVAINDASMSIAYIAYLLQRESPLSAEDRASVVVVGEFICIQGSHKIRVSQKHDLVDIAWQDAGVHYVVECTGLSFTRERCWGHVTGGAKGVIIAGQSADAPVLILGANEADFKVCPVVCAGLPVAVALAPLIRFLHDQYGIEEFSYTVIHGLRPAEITAGRSKNPQDWRQTRVDIGDIVPYIHTGEKTMDKVFPALVGRISGSAFQVPVTRGCAVDVLVRLRQPVSKELLDETLKGVATGRLSEVFLYLNEDFISRDCMPNGKLYYDAASSHALREGEAHKLLLWVDLDGSYAKRLLSLVVFFASAGSQ
ncbi:putative glyceraldehyde-3-phosphate dehydrogenase [Trypanosoma rangeli]|uniref:Putative glyceraldehyde-3-phosphate dehydrogenase n=1 Tax=Trypanosoma rangeli TaxID=5698 RepID=A0A3R7LC67_TRYRA|nr:putative glyceraldehyde-3-phosphate dehydrogenase [Trypanosoma rangeli]RNF11461.1 putative glyceraldehyde-3-phosphate dehydrogenase [Trypanosoma rangeli]|eukprot:RNF11461.1 putative glyceraldehyde-3-phosphate dehydrogenase [Trypanosoma rangeli]